MKNHAKLHDVVALLGDLPESKLSRGQVGTVIDELDGNSLLVEFSDDEGRAYAVTAVEASKALVLHTEPVAA